MAVSNVRPVWDWLRSGLASHFPRAEQSSRIARGDNRVTPDERGGRREKNETKQTPLRPQGYPPQIQALVLCLHGDGDVIDG